MVFFVCEGCNESLKKNQVDKHAVRCRSCYAVTCVDCQVTFQGDDYAAHITCISEAEKYEKSMFKGKKAKKSPQEQWLTIVEEATRRANTASPSSIRPYLLRIGELSNVPRNQKKFCNFIKNSLSIHTQSVIDEIWSFLEAIKKEYDSMEPSQSTVETVSRLSDSHSSTELLQTDQTNETNEQDETGANKKRKKKKRDRDENGTDLEMMNQEKKKKKKKHHIEVENASGTSDTGDEEIRDKEKKKKKKKIKVIDSSIKEEKEHGSVSVSVLRTADGDSSDLLVPQKKKKKKSDVYN